MIDVPANTPVTKPVLSIVATETLDDVQAFVEAGVPFPDNCVVFPTHADNVPDIIGKAFIVTVAVI